MNILDITDKERSRDYVSEFIVRPLVLPGHLKLNRHDISKLEEIVLDALLNTVPTQNLQSNLGHYTKNWSMDWYWIAHHITWDFYNVKQAKMFMKFQSNNDKLYKRIQKTDSPEAWKLYLTDISNFNSEPKLFSLAELIENGSNIGRQKSEWKPVIGITDFGFRKYYPDDDPECEEIEHYWDNTSLASKSGLEIWDEAVRSYQPNPNLPPLTERQKKLRSLIKISINGKEIDRGIE